MKKPRMLLRCLMTMLLAACSLQLSVPLVSHSSKHFQQHAQSKNAQHLRSAIYRFSSSAVPSCTVYFQLSQEGMAATERVPGTAAHCMQSAIQFDGATLKLQPMLFI